MKIQQLNLFNIKSFKNGHSIELSEKVNLLVGKNNTGKSTILSCLHSLQEGGSSFDHTYNESNGHVQMTFKGNIDKPLLNWQQQIDLGSLKREGLNYLKIFSSNSERDPILQSHENNVNGSYRFKKIPNNNNNFYIYPILSNRKVSSYNNDVSKGVAETVRGNFSNLPAKVDELSNFYAKPLNDIYTKACEDIIGFPIASVQAESGKEPAYMIENSDNIPLRSMGEGIVNMLGLIVDLCKAENKLFLIEEPENDLHPQAQKALCRLILERAKTNQFVISTHSNIIVKGLGIDNDTKIFHLTTHKDNKYDKLMVSSVNEIDNTDEEARIKVLEDLGYEFSDLGHWAAWLFLEESSAEVFIRDYFIRWFTPNLLGKVKTLAAKSLSRVNKRFDEFNEMFVYIHLSQIYKNKAWVVIDGGEGEEKKVIEELKEKYVKTNGWSEDRFRQLTKHNFEEYYPEQFQEEVKRVLNLSKKEKWQAKKELLNAVKEWIKEDDNRAKAEFEKSAAEIISMLKEIESELA